MNIRRTLVVGLLTIAGTVEAAGDAARGSRLAEACAPCHGTEGISASPAFPIIAGQHEIYLLQALNAYQEGRRSDAVMAGAVRTYTKQQLEDLAAHFAGLRGLRGQGGAVGTGEPGGAAEPAAKQKPPAGPAPVVVLPAASAAAAPAGAHSEARCPDPRLPADRDGDGDGVADRYDAAPNDPNEFVRDGDGDGWFEICNIQQLQAIQNFGGGLSLEVRSARRYKLVKDLDASAIANFLPIGNCGPQGNCMLVGDKFGFTGVFDGLGHTIRNLHINRPDAGGVGLFGVVAKPGVVRNLAVTNADIAAQSGAGLIVGANFGRLLECDARGRITGQNAVGGAVGGNAGLVDHCHARVIVNAQDAVGGLIGDMRGMVAHSTADSRVSGRNGVGGLVGLNTFARVLASSAAGSATGRDNVGGLVGVNTDALVAESSAATTVEATGTNAGGLVGFNSQSRIRNSYATGRVSGRNAVGGLVGGNNGVVLRSYASGAAAGAANVAELVGDNANGTVTASYSGAELRNLSAAASGWAPPQTPQAEPENYFCDLDDDGVISDAERDRANYVWNFGVKTGPPALRCAEDVSRRRGRIGPEIPRGVAR